MKVVVCGSRTITDKHLVFTLIGLSPYNITTLIHGGATGVDQIAGEYAEKWGISTVVVKPDWDRYGKSAGYKRNAQMVSMADAVIAIWDGKSKGTKHTINLANDAKIPVTVYNSGEGG
jgi:hypothetical protein